MKDIHSTATFLVVNFDVAWEFSIQNTCHWFRERFFKAFLYTHISLSRQNYVLFVNLPITCQVKHYYGETLCEHLKCNHVCAVIMENTHT